MNEDAPSVAVPTENASRIIWILAWPAVALNSLQVINNLLDRLFIGHLSDSSITAHGGSINVLFLMFSLSFSLGTGATALVSRAFGARQRVEYRRASRQAFRLSVITGFVLAVITILTAYPVAGAILPSEDTAAIHEMAKFTSTFALGLPAICIIQVLAGCLRGIGDTKSPMVISGVQILLHMTLNFFLIGGNRTVGSLTIPGANLGLMGAGIAMSVSAWCAALVYTPYVRTTPLGPVHQIALPGLDWSRRILRVAIPAAVMATLRVLSLTAFTVALAHVPHGSSAIAAMSIGFGIESIMFMPSFGLSVAAGALVGQSLGMQRPDRAARLGWTAAHWAGLVTLALCIPISIFAPAIAHGLVGDKPVIVDLSVSLLRLLCLTEVLFAYGTTLMGAMQGAGDTVRPLWITVFSLWGLRVPLAYTMALQTGQPLFGPVVMPIGIGLGAIGGWYALAGTQAVQGVLSMIAWQRGAWRHREV